MHSETVSVVLSPQSMLNWQVLALFRFMRNSPSIDHSVSKASGAHRPSERQIYPPAMHCSSDVQGFARLYPIKLSQNPSPLHGAESQSE